MKKMKKKKKPLVIASSASAFWVHQGPTLRSLFDLAKFFEIITEEQFAYHAKRDGNDFARWAADILQDKLCAGALKRARTLSGARAAVRRSLARYDV